MEEQGAPPVADVEDTAAEARARALFPPTRVMTIVAGGIVALDQATKALVNAHVPVNTSAPVIPGLLDLTHVRNTGAAFGLLNAGDFPFKSALMTLIAAVALVAIVVFAAQSTAYGRLARTGLALVLGGAIGNLIDRVTAGYVIDFVDVYWRQYHFWAFNVADSAITIGATFLILDMLTTKHHVPETL